MGGLKALKGLGLKAFKEVCRLRGASGAVGLGFQCSGFRVHELSAIGRSVGALP